MYSYGPIKFCPDGKKSKSSSSIVAVDTKSKKLLFSIEDERLLRRKYDLHESNARQWCLDQLKKYNIDYNDNIKILDTNGVTLEELQKYQVESNLMGANLGHYIAKQTGNHHLYHAWNAYAQSGFSEAAILVLDGCDYPGGSSIAIFDAKGDKIEPIKRYNSNYSLGVLYGLGCLLCGFDWNDSGKLMALASYAHTDYYKPMFNITEDGELIPEMMLQQGEYINNAPCVTVAMCNEMKSVFDKVLGCSILEQLQKPFSIKNAGIADFIQNMYTASLRNLVRWIGNTIKSKNFILTGGCALNVVANYRVLNKECYMFDDIYIPNQCDDSGNALGAAIMRYGIKIDKPLKYNRVTYPVPKEYNRELSILDLHVLLTRDKILAWFDGGSEYGPRALGHRSLFANASNRYMKYRLNEIKGREYWRPVAPIVSDTFAERNFYIDPRGYSLYENMLSMTFFDWDIVGRFPCVAHIDGSARIQIVDTWQENPLSKLLRVVGIMANTSMNGKNEPIIETPEQAIEFCSKYDDIILCFVKNGKVYTNEKSISYL